MPLSAKQLRFVQEYCRSENGTEAAIVAGYSKDSAQEQASALLCEAMILDAIVERRAELAAAAGLTVERVLQGWMQIAFADANELTQLRRVCCRHCWGVEYRYQWTEPEFSAALDRSIANGQNAPDGIGGFDFDVNADPNPECPECGGNGVEQLYVADTRKLKGNAKRLYAGVQRTKDGLKVLTRDQDAAMRGLASFLGMNKDQISLIHHQTKTLDDFYSANTKPGAA